MKITSFNPLIVTKDAEPVVKLFEELGFEKRHVKEGISKNNVTDIRMKDLQDMTEFWMAAYGWDVPKFPYVFTIWQYDCEGRVDGIPTNVDLNLLIMKK